MKYLFEVRIKEGHTAEEYASAWVRASELIQKHHGALGTELRRKIGEPDKLLAIASWDSKADRDAMEASHDSKIDEIIRSAAPFVEVTPIGEFEEPDWVVEPGN
ncbi:antibiotic biosynthesis monooxygenase [Microbulbifer flavimaris]|uniref:Antibiotic biosynthesis monooxygenase n=1 Tax=Microbulbifer flavimaris TaxID=1781068 RepID=A0ABX4I141_9GAMM|nr:MULTISPECIES: antibiotic biosynthesis monooxygenase [Microbulbifer]KUJ83962.1 antibiotic biosynthesis monooxygenase [Microbulbifer sp. ZGT114]PCO06140.1 antibiotic biosynthesis monooxygenase [Microbulbifer flavimaris]